MRRICAALILLPVVCGCQLAFSSVGSWTRAAGPTHPIQSSNVVALADGRLAIFGGLLPSGTATNDTTLYDPSTGSLTTGAPMPGLDAFPDVVAALHDGTVLVEGGRDINGNLVGTTWLYDPAKNAWSLSGSVNLPRAFPSYATLSDGRVLMVGGSVLLANPEQTPNGETNFKPIAGAEIYDPRTHKWSPAGQLSGARNGIGLVAVGDGGAIAVGGCQGAAGWSPPVTTVELYDPSANTWALTTSLPVAVCAADGVGLRDGRALIVDQGVYSGVERYFYNSTDDAFVYDPKTRSWSPPAGLAGGGTSAVMLSDGSVLVPEFRQGPTHGHSFDELVGGQIFDPATNQWTYVSTTSVSMPLVYLFGRSLQQIAVTLPNGKALVVMETVALAFDPKLAPPATQVLDSTGLTFELGAAVLVIVLLMLIAYRRAGRTDLSKLA